MDRGRGTDGTGGRARRFVHHGRGSRRVRIPAERFRGPRRSRSTTGAAWPTACSPRTTRANRDGNRTRTSSSSRPATTCRSAAAADCMAERARRRRSISADPGAGHRHARAAGQRAPAQVEWSPARPPQRARLADAVPQVGSAGRSHLEEGLEVAQWNAARVLAEGEERGRRRRRLPPVAAPSSRRRGAGEAPVGANHTALTPPAPRRRGSRAVAAAIFKCRGSSGRWRRGAGGGRLSRRHDEGPRWAPSARISFTAAARARCGLRGSPGGCGQLGSATIERSLQRRTSSRMRQDCKPRPAIGDRRQERPRPRAEAAFRDHRPRRMRAQPRGASRHNHAPAVVAAVSALYRRRCRRHPAPHNSVARDSLSVAGRRRGGRRQRRRRLLPPRSTRRALEHRRGAWRSTRCGDQRRGRTPRMSHGAPPCSPPTSPTAVSPVAGRRRRAWTGD